MTQTSTRFDLAHSEARLPRWMLWVASAGTLGILLSTHVRLSAGFAVGSGLAILSYFWLHSTVEALVNAGQVRPPKRVMAKVLVRYPLMAACIFAFYKTGWLPLTGILAGFFVPVVGVLIESIILLRALAHAEE